MTDNLRNTEERKVLQSYCNILAADSAAAEHCRCADAAMWTTLNIWWAYVSVMRNGKTSSWRLQIPFVV